MIFVASNSSNVKRNSGGHFVWGHFVREAFCPRLQKRGAFSPGAFCPGGILSGIRLKKAFDTIDTNLLCKKLEHLGVRDIVNDWLKSYLNNRKQYVEINKVRSDSSKVVCGVPQGSLLGPVLFILYINDICNISKLLNMILFADDTNLFRSGQGHSCFVQRCKSGTQQA